MKADLVSALLFLMIEFSLHYWITGICASEIALKLSDLMVVQGVGRLPKGAPSGLL